MSRSGYTDDCEHLELYRASVERAIKGKRGQAFLQELLVAMDSLPRPRLISSALQDDNGEVCAIGAIGVKRGVAMQAIDFEEASTVAKAFGIARALAAEIEYENDEAGRPLETLEQRFIRMREWVVKNLATA